MSVSLLTGGVWLVFWFSLVFGVLFVALFFCVERRMMMIFLSFYYSIILKKRYYWFSGSSHILMFLSNMMFIGQQKI